MLITYLFHKLYYFISEIQHLKKIYNKVLNTVRRPLYHGTLKRTPLVKIVINPILINKSDYITGDLTLGGGVQHGPWGMDTSVVM